MGGAFRALPLNFFLYKNSCIIWLRTSIVGTYTLMLCRETSSSYSSWVYSVQGCACSVTDLTDARSIIKALAQLQRKHGQSEWLHWRIPKKSAAAGQSPLLYTKTARP